MLQTFERAIVEQCAPTLAGIKPANLFRLRGEDTAAILRTAEEWDLRLRPYDIRVLVLKECLQTNACIIYLYRKDWIEKILKREDNQRFLQGIGYTTQDMTSILAQLSRRLCLEKEYPHEIGIFLGYPLTDVIGFIENKGQNFTCCGCWKSYGDPEVAQKCFARYRACTALYKQMHRNGVPVTQMVVAA